MSPKTRLRIGEVAHRIGVSTTYVRDALDELLQPEVTPLGRLYDADRVERIARDRAARKASR